MNLTGFTDHSLRVLIDLAAAGPSGRATIAESATAFGISENHLTKVAHLPGRQGWIDTVRGKGGGILLAKQPQDICDSVLDTARSPTSRASARCSAAC